MCSSPRTDSQLLLASFNKEAAAGLTASWEIHADDIVLHALVTDGKLDAGPGPAPGGADLVITVPVIDELPSYRNLMQAIKCGLAVLSGRRKLLDTFVRVFTVSQPE